MMKEGVLMDFKSPRMISLYKIIIMIMSTAVLLFLFGICAIIISFANVHANFYNTMLLIAVGIIIGVLGCTLWKVIRKKFVYIPICSIVCVWLIVMLSFSAYYSYFDSIPTVGESDNIWWDYSPFSKHGKVATLDEEPTLKLTDNIPRLDGATALYPIYSSFVRAVYTEPTDNAKPADGYINCSTTAGAYKNIVDGNADIIFVGAPSKKQEEYAESKGVKLIYTPIGKEAFVFFVNSENPISDITVEQIQEIYSGKIDNWGALGIEGLGKIRAFQREEGSGSQSALVRLMEGRELMAPPKEDVIEGMGGIITKTADYRNYKNALGYSFRFYSTEMVKNNQIKLLSVDGIEPTLENIENDNYPIASHFYAVTRAERDTNTEKLINWILGKQGQELIEKTGYTPLN